MAATFDAATLYALRRAAEVGIITGRSTRRPIIIWVVVAGDAVFVRSFRGPSGKWYRTAVADGQVTLETGGRRIHGRISVVTDPSTIEAVSAAFLAKYAASPYAGEMVRAEVLSTTLRVDPEIG